MSDATGPDNTTPPAYTTPPPAAAPAYAAPPAPAYAGTPTTFPGKTLGIVALVVVFFFSLLGLILGYVARSQSKSAGMPNTPAKVAIILGWVFLALSIIGGIILTFVAIAGFGVVADTCARLGNGVWTLDNGTTITCGG